MKNPYTEDELVAAGKKAVIIVLIILWCFLVWMFSKALTAPPSERPQHAFSIEKKIEFDRLLRKHDLQYEVSVLEIHADGSLWYERDGEFGRQLCQLK